MSIKFHCEHCGKRIDAPDNAGGKWGKCPACHNKVYVPQPNVEEDDELKLAPIDETDEERQKRLLAESYQITQSILQEKNAPPDAGVAPSASAGEISEDDLTDVVIHYLRQMYEGDLDDAQRTAETIAAHRRQSKDILDQLATSDPPDPELMDIPPTLLSGFIRNLRTRIS